MDNEQRALLDSVEVPIFVLEQNADNHPVYVALNEIACEMAGFSLANVLGKTAIEVYPGRFGQLAYENHCECFSNGETTTYELQLSLDTQEIHIRTKLAPIADKAGKVKRIVGTSSIIDAEYLIRETHEKSVVLNAEIEQLINLSAHDLRSPMRNVKNLTEMLAEGFVDLGDGKLSIINLLKKVSNSTFALIDNILDYAQTTGTAESIEEFELAPLCHEILSMLDPTNKHTANIDKVSISGDKLATQITLRNLIDNAFKHNDNAVEISIQAKEPVPGHFQISVADNGIGSENPQKLFDHGALRQIDGGHGLRGVTRMLNQRKGEISAATVEDGRGMVVQFTLPGRVFNRS